MSFQRSWKNYIWTTPGLSLSILFYFILFSFLFFYSHLLSSFLDQHHWAGSWGPRSGGSGSAVHGQPKLAGHPLQLLHRAAHAQHQSLSEEEEKDMKVRWFSKKKKRSERKRKIIARWIPLYSPHFPPQISKIGGFFLFCLAVFLKGHCRTQKGICSCELDTMSLFFYSCCWSKTKDTSNFVRRRKRTLKFRGSLAGQEGRDHRRKRGRREDAEKEPQHQVNWRATDILLTVRHKDNS